MRVKKIITLFTVTALTLGSLTGCGSKAGTDSKKSDASSNKKVEITNVSYDPTRELYEEYNKIFQKHWKQKSGQDVSIIQSHGGVGIGPDVYEITEAHYCTDCSATGTKSGAKA